MQVPRSAIGKTGMCPTCNQTMIINADNASAAPSSSKAAAAAATRPSTGTRGGGGGGAGGGGFFQSRESWWQGGGGEPPEDAKRRFGEAVDLFYSGRYAEAVAIFNTLSVQYPNNPDIENGRTQCMRALKRPPTLAIENKAELLEGAELNAETVKQVILEKLLTSASEQVQLQAAELAGRMFGLFDGKQPQDGGEPVEGEETRDDESDEVEEDEADADTVSEEDDQDSDVSKKVAGKK
jgi:hypothetical protein